MHGVKDTKHAAYVCLSVRSAVICRLYKLTLSAQAKIPLQLTVVLSDLA